MKILIIGIKGFIGSNLATYLQVNDQEVWGTDVSVEYGAKKYIVVDPSNADYSSVFSQNQFDVCINCAGAADVYESVKNPKRDFYLNAKLVFDILEAIRTESPHCKFVQMSSAAVYGNPVSLPIHENYPVDPISPYGWHKYQSELLCKEFTKVYGVKTCILRLFSVYGPGLKKQLFWDLYQKSQLSNKIELFGTGNESRDFIYITDVCKAIAAIIRQCSMEGDEINVASGIETTIRRVTDIFLSNLGMEYTSSFKDKKRTGDPLNWRADIRKLNSFGFFPEIDIQQGVKNYTQWLNERR